MASFVKFQQFVEDLSKGVHQLHAAGHTVNVYLTNAAPNVSTNKVKGDLAGITEQNGYAAADIQNDLSRSGGTATMTGTDVEWTGTGGSFGPFQYAVLYNDTAANDPLIGYWDYGAPMTVNTGEKFKVDFGASILDVA